MEVKLRRRSVYVGTIVAMAAMIGGFALASAGGPFGGTNTNSGYNHGSLSAASTIYDGGGLTVSYAAQPSAPNTCTASPSAQTGTSASVYVGSSCTAGHWFAEFTLTATTVTAATLYSDTITVTESVSAQTGSIQIDLTPALTGSFTLHVFLDLQTATAPATVGTVTATATGS